MVIFKSTQKKLEDDVKIKLYGKRLYPTESVYRLYPTESVYLGLKIDVNLT